MKTNPDSLPLTPAVLLPYCRDCRDLSEWPERWMGEEKDLPPGRKLVEYFMPFLLHLARSGLSKRTIQNHVDNMWLLGGEIIRDVNENPALRKVTVETVRCPAWSSGSVSATKFDYVAIGNPDDSKYNSARDRPHSPILPSVRTGPLDATAS